jgi:small neutral amino acid transporter SnatA (MarC family)
MQDSSHLTIILCSSVKKIVISHKQKLIKKIIIKIFFLLFFMFSKKIIIKLFKIAPENFQTHT